VARLALQQPGKARQIVGAGLGCGRGRLHNIDSARNIAALVLQAGECHREPGLVGIKFQALLQQLFGFSGFFGVDQQAEQPLPRANVRRTLLQRAPETVLRFG